VYIDAAYCYNSIFCLPVTLVSPAKTAELIDMRFGLRTRVGPGNHVLDGGPNPRGKGQILGEEGASIIKYRDTLRSSLQKRLN